MTRTWADLDGQDFVTSSSENNYRVCPFCGDEEKHFYANRDNGAYNCFKCSGHGWMKLDLKQELKRRQILPPVDSGPIWQERELPPFTALTGEAIYYLARPVNGCTADPAAPGSPDPCR